jgi:PhnB protein
MEFHPYLYFGGNCREAFERYHEIFGGELTVLTGADAPPGEVPEGKGDLVMHAALVGDALLMASDSYDDDFAPVHGMYVHFSTKDVGEAKRVFDALAEGGTIEAPGGEVFWSPFFGVCRDRFGTPWQVSAEAPAEG